MGTDAGIRTEHYPLDTLDTLSFAHEPPPIQQCGGGKLIS